MALRVDPEAAVAYGLRSGEANAFVLRSPEYPGGQLLVLSDAQLAAIRSAGSGAKFTTNVAALVAPLLRLFGSKVVTLLRPPSERYPH